MSEFISMTQGDTGLVLACARGKPPAILHWGTPVPMIEPDQIMALHTRQHAPGTPDQDLPVSLMNEIGSGFAGAPGFAAHRQGQHWACQFVVIDVHQISPLACEILCEDAQAGLSLRHRIELDAKSEILIFETELENIADSELTLDHCVPVCLPIDPRLTQIHGFTGRWAGEFQSETLSAFSGSYVRENRAGRTSHDTFPGLILSTAPTQPDAGRCCGFHLGWSGNHQMRLDQLREGRTSFQMGELFLPGELILAPGARYTTPKLYAGQSCRGFNDLTQKFHRVVRHTVMRDRLATKPRPVHFNTWEALYFEHEPTHLQRLVVAAAQIGAERFILDDGWFGARRHDRAGLGDWYVSERVYPEGLGPLIGQVKAHGMDFGLWFEPEMVNPDSELYRAHPDWVLQVEGLAQISARGQYVLDLTRPEVGAYLFERLDALLTEYDIAYIKWDMNRNIHHPGSRGRAAAHLQIQHVYALIDRLRRKHPAVEIESCASGGGRADFGILERTDRIWTSDSNDALDRQTIQQGASAFFPLEVLGAHVGPETCHITGRKLSMNLRVATALFGHMGMELNLLDVSDDDFKILSQGIEIYKQYRHLLHAGQMYELAAPDYALGRGVVSETQSEALFSWCNVTGHRDSLPGRLYPLGLDPKRIYQIRLIWPLNATSLSSPSVIEALNLTTTGTEISGAALMELGLQLPLLHPETALLFHLQDVGARS